jgi:hypothetical protein
MIGMTAANPFFPSNLAGAGDPAAAYRGWMMSMVRDKLRTGFERSTASGRM